MTFSKKILIGLFSGIATGLFFGESTGILKWAADGFVRLLQMTVLPYVTISIISSLGSLELSEAKRLGIRVGAVLLIIIILAISIAFLFPIAFPDIKTASFFSTTLLEDRQAFNFIDLYIPSNPFYSLANNIVPAVVLFSIVIGIALIGVEQKQVVLSQLKVATAAISRATRMITRLTPYGLFAIGAVIAGSIQIEQLQRIEVYLITYICVATFVSLWLLPALISTLTGIPQREIFRSSKNALITAFAAGDLFIVLPSLIESCKELLEQKTTVPEKSTVLPDAIVPASFNFPHTGKILSLSFILFAGWASDAIVPIAAYPKLALIGFLTFFGSLNSAVPFLLDEFRIPADSFQLFLATGVINSRFGSLVAAVHTLTIGILGSIAIVGALRVRMSSILKYLITTALLTLSMFIGLRVIFATVLMGNYTGGDRFRQMQPLFTKTDAKMLAQIPAAETIKEPSVTRTQRIRERGSLRICFLSNRVPYIYINEQKKVTGLDMEMGQCLGKDLGVQVEFIPTFLSDLFDQLNSGQCDLAMGGIAVTPLRARTVLFSEAYMDETFAFIVKDHLRHQFESWDKIRENSTLHAAIPDLPTYIEQIKRRAPSLKLEPFSPNIDPPELMSKYDVILLPAERGSIFTLMFPDFTVVIPKPDLIKVPLGYPIANHDLQWMEFINSWIELKKKDGTIDALYRHWILGQTIQKETPRWSIIRNVLGWVK